MKTINPKDFPVIDLETHEYHDPRFCLAVDMLVRCIRHERRSQRPIKAIIMSRSYYQMLKYWVSKNYPDVDENGGVIAEGEYYIDTVMIRQETIYTGKTLLIEYFKKEELN